MFCCCCCFIAHASGSEKVDVNVENKDRAAVSWESVASLGLLVLGFWIWQCLPDFAPCLPQLPISLCFYSFIWKVVKTTSCRVEYKSPAAQHTNMQTFLWTLALSHDKRRCCRAVGWLFQMQTRPELDNCKHWAFPLSPEDLSQHLCQQGLSSHLLTTNKTQNVPRQQHCRRKKESRRAISCCILGPKEPREL